VARGGLRQGRQVWLLGSPAEVGICEGVRALAPGAVNLAGRTRLVDAVDLLSAADTVVSNDSGLMHVASAVGARVVAVFGSTSPEFTPPLGDRARVVRLEVPCSPCFQRTCPLGHTRCLGDLSPAQVVEAL
jgi:heptosyltransferase-2